MNSTVIRLGISNAIISTEPKAHYAYIKWAVEQGLDFLVDKPIFTETYGEVITNGHSTLYKRFLEINNQIQDVGVNAAIMMPRRMHPALTMVYSYLKDFVKTFGVPIAHLNFYHGEGMWNMPNEFFTRDNHPYNRGYGALFHTGYHFVDLIMFILKINELINRGSYDMAEFALAIVNPADVCGMIGEKAYTKLIGVSSLTHYINNMTFLGEVDWQLLLNMYSSNSIIATCNLDMRQSNYSARKSSILPRDVYKKNGRIYHELLEIEVPHLLTIHLARMTVGDQKDRKHVSHKEEDFVVQIYRNQNIVGGNAFEEIVFPYDSELNIDSNIIKMNLGDIARYGVIHDWLYNSSEATSWSSHQYSMKLFAEIHTLIAKLHNSGTSMGYTKVPFYS